MEPRFISAKYHAPTLTVDYVREDGKHLVRTGGPIAWRFNNPGNMRPKHDGKPINGAIGVGTTSKNGMFLIFASYEEGRFQKKALLRRKFNDRTIYTMLAGVPNKKGQMVNGYAPASDKNDPHAYANFISSRTGFPTTAVLSSLTDADLEKIMDAMEIKEGYHSKQQKRDEKWLDATGITISDGANPKPGLPAAIKIGDKTYHHRTDERGQLPPIAHTKNGERVEIHLPDIKGILTKQFEFVMSRTSAAYVLFHYLQSYQAETALKKPPPSAAPAKRTPIRYVVQTRDTLPKLAARFKCSVASIVEYNPAIKDVNKIYVGQALGIYGPLPQAKHKALPPLSTAPSQAMAARSKEGKGQPLAIINPDQRRAPWMSVAIDEAKRWAGAKEGVITKTLNYHHEIGAAGNLTSDPWCASFVNFCLKTSGTPYEVSRASQFACTSKKFIRIDRPVYGALMVMRNYVVATGKYTGLGHVTFVYGKTSNGAIAGLGGNQLDTIHVSPYALSGVSSTFTLHGIDMEQRFYAFYIPATYAEFAKHESELETVSPKAVDQDLLGIKILKRTKNEGTR